MSTADEPSGSPEEVRSFLQLVKSIHSELKNFNGSAQPTLEKLRDTDSLLYSEGVSILSLKNHLLLSYLHHLLLIVGSKLRGRPIHPPDVSPSQLSSSATLLPPPSSAGGKDEEGSEYLIVPQLVKIRLMLEKIRPLESKLRYQVDKLVRAAEDQETRERLGGGRKEEEEGEIDPLSFRPNPAALLPSRARNATDKGDEDKESGGAGKGRMGKASASTGEEVYRPPKLAPMPYDENAQRGKRKDRESAPSSRLLSTLAGSFSSDPHSISASGLGQTSHLRSSRAKALERMTQYEEENMTRLVMTKKDAKRRKRDEADVALGGAGLTSGKGRHGRMGGGYEEEFGDLLRGYDRDAEGGTGGRAKKRSKTGGGDDGRRGDEYDVLRKSGRKTSALERARETAGGTRDEKEAFGGGGKARVKGKFDKAVGQARKKARRG